MDSRNKLSPEAQGGFLFGLALLCVMLCLLPSADAGGPARDLITRAEYQELQGVIASASLNSLGIPNHNQIDVDAAGITTFPADVAIGDRLHIHSGSIHLKALATDTVPEAGGVIIHAIETNGHTRPVFVDDDGRQFIVGEDATILVKNTTGSTITKGSAVYISGSSGNLALVSPAKADSLATLPACGFTIADITNNGTGHVIVLGVAQQIDTSAWSSGDEVYVSPTTAGEITNSRPVYPNMVQLVGRVLVSGVGNGSIQIAIAPFVGNQETGTPNSFTVGQNLTVTGLVNGASGVASNAALTALEAATVASLAFRLKLDGTTPMTGNLRMGGFWISNDGDSEGIFISTDGNIAIGTNTWQVVGLTIGNTTTTWSGLTGNVLNFNRPGGNSFIDKRDTNALVFRRGASNETSMSLPGDGGIVVASPTTGIPSPVEGHIYFNGDDNHFYGYDGTTWKQLDN